MFETTRLKTRQWELADIDIAQKLWGNLAVTRFIDSRGQLTLTEVQEKLIEQINLQKKYGFQYWILINKETGAEIGCCGYKPYASDEYFFELGFHIMPTYWGQGYATEAARGAIDYAFNTLKLPKLYAGHNPENSASSNVIKKLGFTYVDDKFYAPANTHHPSYELINPLLNL
jgi:RimJ/RimL family protein N-acetyltransferase